MPQFAPSGSKVAKTPITIKPSGLSCNAELYLVSNGAKIATSGIKTFTSTGSKQDISFPITMPDVEGIYPVYLDIITEGILIGAYKAIEDVSIAPAYKVGVDFSREGVCAGGHMEGDVWVCTEGYFPSERQGFITVTNEGAPGSLTTIIEGYLYLEGARHSVLSGTHKQWVNNFEVGQVRTYRMYYMVPITGMAFDSRFFIKVLGPNGEVIAEKAYTTSL